MLAVCRFNRVNLLKKGLYKNDGLERRGEERRDPMAYSPTPAQEKFSSDNPQGKLDFETEIYLDKL